jgi:PPOX class probable F420-dependent enzyme
LRIPAIRDTGREMEKGTPVLTDEIRDFLDVPRVGTLATINADGTPLLTPVWHARDGDDLWFVIEPESPKARNVRRDPRITYAVMDETGDTYLTVRGRARLESGEDGRKPEEMAIRYFGEEAGRQFARLDFIKREIVCRLVWEEVRLRRRDRSVVRLRQS